MFILFHRFFLPIIQNASYHSIRSKKMIPSLIAKVNCPKRAIMSVHCNHCTKLTHLELKIVIETLIFRCRIEFGLMSIMHEMFQGYPILLFIVLWFISLSRLIDLLIYIICCCFGTSGHYKHFIYVLSPRRKHRAHSFHLTQSFFLFHF